MANNFKHKDISQIFDMVRDRDHYTVFTFLGQNLQNFCKKLAKKLKNCVFMRKIRTKQ